MTPLRALIVDDEPLAREELQVRAEAVQARWGLPAHKWIKVLRRLEDVPDVASVA